MKNQNEFRDAETKQEGDVVDNTINGLKADLHVHSTYSDGALAPSALIDKCRSVHLSAIAIADHDHIGGIAEAVAYGKLVNVEVVPAVELSSMMNDAEIHILGYFFDPSDKKLIEHLALFRDERLKRAECIVKKLNTLHIPLTMDAVMKQSGYGAVGRPHIASALVDGGLVPSYHDAFFQYIGNQAPAYEKKYFLSPASAIDIIASAGGLAFLAHPGKYASEEVIRELAGCGLDGIEVIHPSHTASQIAGFRTLVERHSLLESGGSDYHGGRKKDEQVLGAFTVPMHIIENMRARLFSR